jgi:tetratricopeptide (TPR) repeat protein
VDPAPREPRADPARDRAKAAFRVRDYQGALTAAREVLALDPADGVAHAVAAASLMGLDRPAEAQATAEQGLTHAPGLEWLHRVRSNALRAQGRYAEALPPALQVVELAPQEGISHFTLGLAHYCLGRLDEARAALERAVELRPEYAESHRWLGEIALDGDLPGAELHFRDALARDAASAGAMVGLGKILLARGEEDGPLALLDRAVAGRPDDRFVRRDALAAARQFLQRGRPAPLRVAILSALVALAAHLLVLEGKGPREDLLGVLGVAIATAAVVLVGMAAGRRIELRKKAPGLARLLREDRSGR